MFLSLLVSSFVSLNILYNFNEIQQNLNKIQELYGLKDLDTIQESNSSKSCEQALAAPAPSLPKKKPSASASQFEIGHKLKSEHDNRMYEVKLCKGEKRIFKRWVLSK